MRTLRAWIVVSDLFFERAPHNKTRWERGSLEGVERNSSIRRSQIEKPRPLGKGLVVDSREGEEGQRQAK